MSQQNPHTAAIAVLEAELAQLQTHWNNLNSDWAPYTAVGDYSSPLGQSILAERDQTGQRINERRARIEDLRAMEAQWNTAVANAIAQGKTPEAAAIAATADAEQKAVITKALRIGLIILGVVAVFGAIWAIKKFRGK